MYHVSCIMYHVTTRVKEKEPYSFELGFLLNGVQTYVAMLIF